MRALKDEGIDGPGDLKGVDEDFIVELSRGLSQRSYDANGKTLESTKLSARTVSRLKGMVKVVSYLSHVRRDISWSAVKWPNVINFLEEYKILISKADGSQGEVPKYKNGGVVKHVYCLMDYLRLVQGQQGCPLLYLITPDSERDETDAQGAAPLIRGRLFGGTSTSIQDELMLRASRHTAAGKKDNETLYAMLVTSFANTQYAGQAKQYEKSRDGAGYFKHIVETSATSGDHDALGQAALKWIMDQKWTGPDCGPLRQFLEKHTAQRTVLSQAAEHSHIEVLNERSQISSILKNITSKDPDLVACLTQVKLQDGLGADLRNKLADCIVYLCNADYAGKHDGKAGKKRVRMADVAGLGGRPGGRGDGNGFQKKRSDFVVKLMGGACPTTGVDLRYYTKEELDALPKHQKNALFKWRAKKLVDAGLAYDNEKKVNRGGGNDKNSWTKKQIASLQAQVAALKSPPSPVFPVTANASAIEAATAAAIENFRVQIAKIGSAVATASSLEENDGKEDATPDAKTNDNVAVPSDKTDEKVATAAAVGLQSILRLSGKRDDDAGRPL